VNKLFPSERRVGSLAFFLCLLVYAGGGALFCFLGFGSPEKETPSVFVNAVNLSFAQMELVAVEEPPPPKEPEPLPPPEEVDVVLEEIIEELEPEIEPVQAEAQVSQEAASADEDTVDSEALSEWVLEQIQKEKYYPPSAQRAGYEGIFDLLVIIEADGRILDASITYGRGHPLLRRSLEKMLGQLSGRSFGKPIGQAVEMEIEFEFDLE